MQLADRIPNLLEGISCVTKDRHKAYTELPARIPAPFKHRFNFCKSRAKNAGNIMERHRSCCHFSSDQKKRGKNYFRLMDTMDNATASMNGSTSCLLNPVTRS